MLFRGPALLILAAAAAFGQAQTGELRIAVKDPSGLPLQARAEVISQANQYVREFDTNAGGQAVVKRLPFGRYTVTVTSSGFTPATQLVEIRSAIPMDLGIVLGIGPVKTTVNVSSDATLVDPADVSSAERIGNATLQGRLTAQPGRSLAELVNDEPGWLFEANGILHPRGEEYQAQYVVDGIPLTDNRSVAYAPDFDADSVQEMSCLHGGILPPNTGAKWVA